MKNITYINAGAGSGKTTKLTQILSKELSTGTGNIKPSEVILTTFTELAASEFREKSRQQLFKDGYPGLAAELDSATIGTVHSVALSFIQKYWYLIGVSPDMKVMSEDDLQVYISESLGDYVTTGHLKFFSDYRAYFDIKDGQGKADFDFWKNHLLTIIDKANNYSVDIIGSETFSHNVVKSIFCNTTVLNTTLMGSLISILNSEFSKYTVSQQGKVKPLLDSLNNSQYSYAILSKVYKELTSDKPDMGKKNRDNLPNLMGQPDFDNLVKNLKEFLTSSSGNDSPGGMMKQMITTLFKIAQNWKVGFNKFKTKRHIIDYNDMERHFLDLLDVPQVADEIKGTYKLMMVDEFQDSSPIQLEIFKKLSDLMVHSYWVGDPKQSIYGFRGADVELVKQITNVFPNPVDNLIHENLPNSWRTREPLVNLTNDCFSRAFSGIINKSDVVLTAQRKENASFSEPLSHWNCYVPRGSDYSFPDKVADRIMGLKGSNINIQIKGKEEFRAIQYGDIAILCRTNSECKSFADALTKKGIPVSYVNNDILQQTEVQLVFTLLKFMVDSSNKHVRADLMRLLENTLTKDILQERLNYLVGLKADEQDLWLEENSLIKKLNAFRQTVRNLSVSDLIESIIYGLDLPQVVAKWDDEENRRQNLQTLCSMTKSYDEHCLQMGIGASVGGLLTYLTYAEVDTKIDNAADAVKVLTYHGAKGLEWYYVILSSLEGDSLEEKDFTKKCFWGVHEMRSITSTGQYIIQFLPRIVSSPSTNLPQAIIDKCKTLSSYVLFEEKERNELRHLLYVGVTRARDYLITISMPSGQYNTIKPLDWIKNVIESSAPVVAVPTALDLPAAQANKTPVDFWGVPTHPAYYEQLADLGNTFSCSATTHMKLDSAAISTETTPKCISPSSSQEKYNATAALVDGFSSDYIEHGTIKEGESAAFGTCIHNYFAAHRWEGQANINANQYYNHALARQTVENHGMGAVLPTSELLTQAADTLFAYLESTFGAGELLRETPFTYRRNNGQLVQGEIDLIWKTDKECILLDYKNFPAPEKWGKEIVLDDRSDNKFYVKKYFPQLGDYRAALTAAEENVTHVFIFYAVLGCLVEIKFE